MKIAVEGCMHGELDNVYGTLLHLQAVENIKIDLLICCGDFQAARNGNDLDSMHVSPKYRHMKDFWKYYSGEKVAPFPTIFIGGNHEASNYLWELYYGGWAAPNIYFLGYAGVVKFGNIRIAGLSGIYNSRHYQSGYHEKFPLKMDSHKRSIYNVREYAAHKLMLIEEPIDIFLSHDWPFGITDYGNLEQLLQIKPFLRDEIRDGTFGSKPAAELLGKLKPTYWFSAHVHYKFPALVQHEGGPITKFLALDKCLRGRKFLQIVDVESPSGPYEINYDEEWLAITRKLNFLFPLGNARMNFRESQYEMKEYREWVSNRLKLRGAKPFEFVQTVPSYNPSQPSSCNSFNNERRNPQTEEFLRFLELPYLLDNAIELGEEASP